MGAYLRVVVTIDGRTFETFDRPDAIGPWLARMWAINEPGPHSDVRIQIY